jgi:hypothetical protein
MFVARWYAWALLLLGVAGVAIGPIVAVTSDTGELGPSRSRGALPRGPGDDNDGAPPSVRWPRG